MGLRRSLVERIGSLVVGRGGGCRCILQRDFRVGMRSLQVKVSGLEHWGAGKRLAE